MTSDQTNDKPLFGDLGLLSNEIIQIRKTLETIDTQEAQLRALLDELVLEKEILKEQASRLETLVKQAARSALDDAEQESERQQEFERQKSALETQVQELENQLLASEVLVKDLQEQFTLQIDQLKEQVREKDHSLEIREVALKDLKSAADSLNRLIGGLSAGNDRPLIVLDGSQLIHPVETPASQEIERLKSELREKELALAAKSAELDMTKQQMSSRIEDLEKALDARRRRKSQRLVSFISDIGAKRIL